MSIRIVADAASNLFKSILKEKKLDIKVMNMHLTFGDKEYNCYDDDLNIDEFAKEYYEAMDNNVETRTSLVGPGDYLEFFESEVKKGNQVLCLTMAKGISGTYNSACLARDEINEKYGKKVVEVIDSMTAGLGEGMQAIHAQELADSGVPFEELIKECEKFKLEVRSEFTVDNIKYLVKTGRVNKHLGRFIRLMNIKVLLKNDEESKIAFAGSVIGKKNSIKKLAKWTAEKIDDKRKQIIYITHCDCVEDAERLERYLRDEGVKSPVEIYQYDVISGAHIGPRSLAIFYIAKAEAEGKKKVKKEPKQKEEKQIEPKEKKKLFARKDKPVKEKPEKKERKPLFGRNKEKKK